MAERLVTRTELQDNLDAILASVQRGETVVLIDDEPGQPPVRRVVLVGATAYAQLSGTPHESHNVEAAIGGVVAGTGTTLSSLTGNPAVAQGARKLGRRLGRALSVGMDALNEPKKK